MAAGFANASVIRYIPDQPGRGGMRTGLHSLQTQPILETRLSEDFYVWMGRWRKEPGPVDTAAALPALDTCQVLHPFVRRSASDVTAAPLVNLLADYTAVGSRGLWDATKNWAIPYGSASAYGDAAALPAEFVTFGRRCVISEGGYGPAIVYEGGSYHGTNFGEQGMPYLLGVGQPTKAPTCTVQVTPQSVGATASDTAFMAQNSAWLTSNSMTSLIGTFPQGLPVIVGNNYNSVAGTSGQKVLGVTFTSSSGGTPGTGYALAFSSGAAAGHYDVNAAGEATNIVITVSGSGYTSSPTVTFVGGSGVVVVGAAAVMGWNDFTNASWGAKVLNQGRVIDSRLGNIPNPGTASNGTLGGGVAPFLSINTPLVDLDRYVGLECWVLDTSVTWKHFTITFAALSPSGDATQFLWHLDSAGNPPATAPYTSGTVALGEWYVIGAQCQLDTPTPYLEASYLSGSGPHWPKWPYTNAPTSPPGKTWWWQVTYNGGGVLSWTDVGPSYAYGWYDPSTGHISNVSGVTQMPETNQFLANVAFSVGSDAMDYPPTVDTHRFSWIVPVRSVVTGGGSALFPIGPLPTYAKIVGVTPGATSSDPTTITTDGPHGLVNDGAGFPYFWIDDVLGAVGANSSNVVQAIPSPTTFTIPGTVMGGSYTAGTGRAFFLPQPGSHIAAFKAYPPQPAGTTHADSHPDSHLLVSGGLQAPMFTNGRPKDPLTQTDAKLKHITQWDGRLWATATGEPDVVIYSCDAVQCPFGVAIESFPTGNRLRIPAEDGNVTGLKVFGDLLIAFTDRYAYYVAGNTWTNYRLLRYSTSMPGVGPRQAAELTAQIAGEGASLVYLGRDHIVYVYSAGQEPAKLSTTIQPTLDAALAVYGSADPYDAAFVHTISIAGRRCILVGIPSSTLSSGGLFVYDIENKTWSQRMTDPMLISAPPGIFAGNVTAVATQYGTGAPKELAVVVKGGGATVKRWFEELGGTPSESARLVTFSTDFDGRKTFKQLDFVRLYADYDGSAPFDVDVTIDDAFVLSMVFKRYSDPVVSLFGPSAVPVDGERIGEWIALPADADSTFVNGPPVPGVTYPPPAGPVRGHRFSFALRGGGAVAADILALDACYTACQDAQAGVGL